MPAAAQYFNVIDEIALGHNDDAFFCVGVQRYKELRN
jgi:hypothetical protein